MLNSVSFFICCRLSFFLFLPQIFVVNGVGLGLMVMTSKKYMSYLYTLCDLVLLGLVRLNFVHIEMHLKKL